VLGLKIAQFLFENGKTREYYGLWLK